MRKNIPPPLHLGLIGWPLEYSLSPRLHLAALQERGIPGEYRLYPIPPLPQGRTHLSEILDRMRRGELHGLNATIPHKQNMLPLMDELTPVASGIGAVNTIYLREGRLVGDNTDAAGFQADLEKLIPPGSCANSHQAIVLGAGGAARAVVYVLTHLGWEVTVVARRLEQAQQLAGGFLDVAGKVNPLQMGLSTLTTVRGSLIVNTIPPGMPPDQNASPWPLEVPFPPGAAIYDLVYKPEETRLVQVARSAGLRAANGLGMLIEQAALAFEIWTGQTAPRNVMREAVSQSPEKG